MPHSHQLTPCDRIKSLNAYSAHLYLCITRWRPRKMCYFYNKLRHLQGHKLAREPANFPGSRVEFRRWAIVLRLSGSLNFPSASYLDRQCMHSGRMSRCYTKITRKTFSAETSWSCNGPAVWIGGNKTRRGNRGSSTPVSTVYENRSDFPKQKYLESDQYPVCMTQTPRKGDLREFKSKKTFPGGHAPRPPNKIHGKIIILFKVLFLQHSARRRGLKLVELHLWWIQRCIWEILAIIIFCCCQVPDPSFTRKFFVCLFVSSDGISIARYLRHLFITGFVKNTLTTVINKNRIKITVLTLI